MDPILLTFFILAIVLSVIGLIGAVAPAIPGPPISWLALLCPYFTTDKVSGTTLLTTLAMVVIVTALDYLFPIWFTKIGGGSKKAIWGSTLGLIVGLFFPPFGLIVGPFLGAFAGELMNDGSDVIRAGIVAFWSFVSFIFTTGLKIVCCLVLSYYTFIAYFS